MAVENYNKVKQVLWLILFANLLVAILKIIAGTIIRSASLTADGFHSLSDGSSNIVGLIGISIASKPVDEDHHYGHRKYESLASLVIAGMLFIIGGNILANSISRFFNPIIPKVSLESLIILISTLIINIFVCSLEYKQGKDLNSEILVSDSKHTRSDIYISAGVLVSLACIKLGLPAIIDPIASLVVAGFIFYASYEIFSATSGILVDKAVMDTDKIRQIVNGFAQVKNIHKIRCRGDENDVYIDMHVVTEPDMNVEQSHELIHSIEKKLQQEINKNIQLIAHFEPFENNTDDP